MNLADNKATLSFSNGNPNIELPIYSGSVGPDVIDIRKLYAQTGMLPARPARATQKTRCARPAR